MDLYSKRGQFFLLAALIVISVIFGFGIVYIYASSPEPHIDVITSLANNIKYESVMLANQGVYYNRTSTEIEENIVNMTYYYSKSYPQYNITLIYETSATQFKDGNKVSIHPSTITSTSRNVTLSLNNLKYIFNLTNGHDIYIILNEEDENEKFIATA